MPDISGIALINGVPTNGAAISAYKASRFARPSYDTAPPGSPDVSGVTSGQPFGGDGEFVITVQTFEKYWIAMQSGGHTGWAEADCNYVDVTSAQTISGSKTFAAVDLSLLTITGQAGSVGSVLTSQGAGNPPAWATSGATAGPISARPAAGSAGRFYLASDVGPAPGTLYEDNGTQWLPIVGLTEIGYAELTSGNITTTSTTAIDVPGIAVPTFTVGDRPYMIGFSTYTSNNTTGQAVFVQAAESIDGNAYQPIVRTAGVAPFANGVAFAGSMFRRRSPVTRGHTLAYKLQWYVGGGTGTMFGGGGQQFLTSLWVHQV